MRIGDIDGDGQDDVVAGAFQAEVQTGGAFALPGPLVADGVAQEVGHRLTGEVAGSGAGRSLSLGDLDGDGLLDIGLGAPYARVDGLYVAFGPRTADVAPSDAGVALLRAPSGAFGGHGADLGDMNGDGQTDAAVGAYYVSSPSGTVYVVFGPVTSDVELETDADATLTGEPGDVYAGRIVSAAGDLDGDGVGDLVIGCLGSMGPPGSGGFYVVHGPPVDMDLTGADGRYAGESSANYASLWLATGDLDGDGLADVVAAAMDDTLADTAGAACVVNGPAAGNTDLSAADIIVRGDTAGQYGGGVATGDLDGDGVMELLLGAQGDPTMGSTAGAAFLFWDPAPGTYVLSDADAAFYAESAGDNLGTGMAVGDVDGDGAQEIVIGAPYEGTGGSRAGAVYVMAAE